MPSLNKQPIFTAIPLIKIFGGDLKENGTNTTEILGSNLTIIYVDESAYGTLIRKITVTADGIIARQINSKRIDLYIAPRVGDNFTLYKSDLMVGLKDLTQQEDEIPKVVFDFPEGLIIPSGTAIGLTTTLNNASSAGGGDLISVVLEGGTYDQPE